MHAASGVVCLAEDAKANVVVHRRKLPLQGRVGGLDHNLPAGKLMEREKKNKKNKKKTKNKNKTKTKQTDDDDNNNPPETWEEAPKGSVAIEMAIQNPFTSFFSSFFSFSLFFFFDDGCAIFRIPRADGWSRGQR